MLISTNQNICSLVWLKFPNLVMAVMEMAYESKVYTLHRDLFIIAQISNLCGGHRDRDRMVVGLATTYAISAYHH